MKYLQLFDHLGNLVKEFEVFVDGQDFTWAAPKPEPVWLGTIRLSSEKAVGEVEPTPEVVAVEREGPVMPEHPTVEPHDIEVDKKLEIYREAQDVEAEIEKAVEPEPEPESVESEAEQELEAPFTTPQITTGEQPESEVKHEPEKRSHKGRRSKGTGSQSSS